MFCSGLTLWFVTIRLYTVSANFITGHLHLFFIHNVEGTVSQMMVKPNSLCKITEPYNCLLNAVQASHQLWSAFTDAKKRMSFPGNTADRYGSLECRLTDSWVL